MTRGSTLSVDECNDECSSETSRKTREVCVTVLKCGFSVVKETEVQTVITQKREGHASRRPRNCNHEFHNFPLLFTCSVVWTARLTGTEPFSSWVSENHATHFSPRFL